MPELAIDAFAVVAAALVLRARPIVVLSVLLGVAVLVPAPLPVPHTHFSYATVQHVVALAVLGRLLDLRLSGQLRAPAYRGGPALVALGLVAATAFVVGVVFAVHATYSIAILARVFDLATMIVFFVTCLVMMRLDAAPWRALVVAVVVIGIAGVIATIEHFTKQAFGKWLFDLLPDPTYTDAAFPLDYRQDQPRVRAGAEFALQFAWIAVSLLPTAIVVTARTRAGRFGAAAATAFVLATVYWSYSRSALAFAGIVVLLLALLSRDPRVVSVLAAGAVAAGALLVAHPAVLDHLSASADEGSISLRFDRLSTVIARLAAHPFRGLGLGNVSGSGVKTTDNALLLSYAELGAFGLVVVLVLFVVLLVQCSHAILRARPDERPIALACALGALCYVASAQVYDAFSLLQGSLVLWYLVALASVVAERGGGLLRVRVPSREVVFGTASAAVAGAGVVVALTPTYVARDYVFTTFPLARDVVGYDTSVAGKRLVATACGEATAIAASLDRVRLHCAPIANAADTGSMHVEAPTAADLEAAVNEISTTVRSNGGIAYLEVYPRGTPVTYRVGIGQAAPAWLPIGALAMVVLL